MQCEHCRKSVADGEPVYRLSLHCGHPWALTGFCDQVVRHVCAECSAHTWMSHHQWRPAVTCQGCGRPVFHDTVRKVLLHPICGEDCRKVVRARLARERRVKPNLVCPICGEPFKPRRTDVLFCKPACRQRAYRQRRELKPLGRVAEQSTGSAGL